jgi:uncharacterized FAD-dependent dehydrogenase
VEAFDAVVIGAGPAGLSAAVELSPHGRCLILDEGAEATARDRDAPRELLSGVGGAGLFSDGKHSFFPSASALWTLPDARARESAFQHTAQLLARFGVDAGSLPTSAVDAPTAAGSWQPKLYRSVYVSPPDRFAMIDALWSAVPLRHTFARVIDAERRGARIELVIDRAGRRETIATTHLIIATGRWSPRWIRPWLAEKLGARFDFLRVEFGVRIETRTDHPLFAQLPGVDGKIRFTDPASGLEFRTFCTCRNGEVVLGEAAALRAFSGRADGPKTGRSNLGLLARTSDAELGCSILTAIARATPESLPFSEWRNQGPSRLAHLFGAAGAQALTTARIQLESFCPAIAQSDTRIHAPCLEGIGEYPICDGALKIAPSVWIAGDASGRFRGIIAAMVSGRYVAQRMLFES